MPSLIVSEKLYKNRMSSAIILPSALRLTVCAGMYVNLGIPARTCPKNPFSNMTRLKRDPGYDNTMTINCGNKL